MEKLTIMFPWESDSNRGVMKSDFVLNSSEAFLRLANNWSNSSAKPVNGSSASESVNSPVQKSKKPISGRFVKKLSQLVKHFVQIHIYFHHRVVEINLQCAISAINRTALSNIKYMQSATDVGFSAGTRFHKAPSVPGQLKYSLASPEWISCKFDTGRLVENLRPDKDSGRVRSLDYPFC